jgi:hypothetical protein
MINSERKGYKILKRYKQKEIFPVYFLRKNKVLKSQAILLKRRILLSLENLFEI